MWQLRAWFVALMLCSSTLSAAAESEADVQRIRQLVQAGVLPRMALEEAENELLEYGYRKTLNRTLLSETLEQSEIQAMLNAAQGLQNIALERLNILMTQVQAGVTPANKLSDARDALDVAKRQSELAETRASLVRQMKRMAASESYLEELEQEELAFRYEGLADYEMQSLIDIEEMFFMSFGREIPVSSDGDTPLHRSMGLDHTGRIDIALHPESQEGQFLMFMLESMGIPYVAFLSAVAGQATGPHIHVGPPSTRISLQESVEFAN